MARKKEKEECTDDCTSCKKREVFIEDGAKAVFTQIVEQGVDCYQYFRIGALLVHYLRMQGLGNHDREAFENAYDSIFLRVCQEMQDSLERYQKTGEMSFFGKTVTDEELN